MNYNIVSTRNKALNRQLIHKINTKTKPLGALGHLEELALQIGTIQNTIQPKIEQPVILVFAGDHGIALEGEVNPFPQEVTSQMVYNFANGGAAINVFCKTNDIKLRVVDAGVNHNFPKDLPIVDAKINFGTNNYKYEPAMSKEKCRKAMDKGAELVEEVFNTGSNTIGFGEMGIGNTSSAALLMSYFTKEPIANCVGSGTGLNPEGIRKKTEILTQVFEKYHPEDDFEALATFGGYEIAMICGAILKAASLRMIVLIDGFIVTSALLCAKAFAPEVVDYCVFAHTSNEKGHEKMLAFLNAKPLLNLGLRLGEGTGSALAVPLLRASVNFLNQMASFESAGISNKE